MPIWLAARDHMALPAHNGVKLVTTCRLCIGKIRNTIIMLSFFFWDLMPACLEAGFNAFPLNKVYLDGWGPDLSEWLTHMLKHHVTLPRLPAHRLLSHARPLSFFPVGALVNECKGMIEEMIKVAEGRWEPTWTDDAMARKHGWRWHALLRWYWNILFIASWNLSTSNSNLPQLQGHSAVTGLSFFFIYFFFPIM